MKLILTAIYFLKVWQNRFIIGHDWQMLNLKCTKLSNENFRSNATLPNKELHLNEMK